MFDYVKFISNKIDIPQLLQNPLLSFKGEYCNKTYEITSNKLIGTHNGMTFIVYDSGTVKIQGSLHKYYNFTKGVYAPNQLNKKQKEKGFNGNDFGLEELMFVINDFREIFQINLTELKVINLEIGLNLELKHEVEKILCYLINHKGTLFSSEIGSQINYKYCKHYQFIIKCYDKALQYGITKNLLRIEIKYIKMEKHNKQGLFVFDDFIKRESLDYLLENLRRAWSEIIMYDYTINKRGLTKKEQNKLKDYSNPSYWKSIKSNRLDRPKKHFKLITNKHSKNTQEEINKMIESKWNRLSKGVTNDHFI